MSGAVRTVHSTVIDASPGAVHDVIAEVERWPAVFAPTVHVEVHERRDGRERLTIWALVNGQVTRWTSRRALDRDRRRITFQQERSAPPIASMSGSWEFLDRGAEGCQVLLHHEFRTVDDDPESVRAVEAAVEVNSGLELAAVARLAGSGLPPERLVTTFRDTMELDAPAAAVYAFLDRADRWPRRLPHVHRADLLEPRPGVQELTMETVTADGAAHTTSSIRLCTPMRSIRYKQTTPPAGLIGHSGAWLLAEHGDGRCRVTAEHTIAVDPVAALRDGAGTDHQNSVDHLLGRFREALRRNSRATMAAALGCGED